MKTTKKALGHFALIALLGAAMTGTSLAAEHTHSLQSIAAGKHRTAENIARNAHRHPVETLEFFDVQPNHTVVEVSPGGGWYTELLGPYLKDEGELYLAIFADDSERSYAPRLNAAIKEMTADKNLYGKVHYTVIDTPDVIGPVAPAESADRVLTFRNVHSWMSDDKAEEVFKSFYAALKPGGILGVVQHRAKSAQPHNPEKFTGYVHEDQVIELATKAGFELMAKSEVNANAKDSSDHPNGVWTLPPSLRLAEGAEMTAEERAKYEAIGESDRMTLKFVKPVKTE